MNEESIAGCQVCRRPGRGRDGQAPLSRRRLRGFTLIELMVAVAVIGILSAIALPSYQTYIRKSRRPDAKTALLDLASREERYFTLNNNYTSSPSALGYTLTGNVWPASLGTTADYALSVTTPAAGATGATFTLQAAAVGDQLNDACGTYTLDNFGNQTNTFPGTAVTGCW